MLCYPLKASLIQINRSDNSEIVRLPNIYEGERLKLAGFLNVKCPSRKKG